MLNSFVIQLYYKLKNKNFALKLFLKLSFIKILYLCINNYVDGKFIMNFQSSFLFDFQEDPLQMFIQGAPASPIYT